MSHVERLAVSLEQEELVLATPASVTMILCEVMEGSAACVKMETRLPSSGHIGCQDSLIKMS